MADNFDRCAKTKDFRGLLRANEAGLSAIIPGIMADYFLGTPENTGSFNVFVAGGAQSYMRNYGVVLFTWGWHWTWWTHVFDRLLTKMFIMMIKMI